MDKVFRCFCSLWQVTSNLGGPCTRILIIQHHFCPLELLKILVLLTELRRTYLWPFPTRECVYLLLHPRLDWHVPLHLPPHLHHNLCQCLYLCFESCINLNVKQKFLFWKMFWLTFSSFSRFFPLIIMNLKGTTGAFWVVLCWTDSMSLS